MRPNGARKLGVTVSACALLLAFVLLMLQGATLGRWAAGVGAAGVFFTGLIRLYDWFSPLRSPQKRLHRLIDRGDEEEIRRLLETRANLLRVTDEHGGTPLHRAAIQCRDRIVGLLLEKGAEANAREELFGFTPLHLLACRTYRPVVGAIHPWLDRCGLDEGANRREGRVASLLLQAGADANLSAGFSRTPLHMASVGGRAELVKLLLEAGADPGARDDLGFTPLHYAAFGGDGRVAKLLVEAGADLGATAELDYMPLHTAAEKGAAEVARVLLEGGARADARTSHSRTPLDLANQHRHEKLANLLLRYTGGESP